MMMMMIYIYIYIYIYIFFFFFFFFFNISPRIGNLLSRQISKTKSIKQMNIFANKIIYFWNKLPNQIKNRNTVGIFKIELDDFKKMVKELNSSGTI